MTRALKMILSFIGLLIVLFILVVVLVTTLVDPNKYKSRLEQYFTNKTGRALSIEGSLNWSFFPWIGFEATNVTIGNPKNFSGTTFAKVGEMNLKLKTMALFSGSIKIKALNIDQADFYMIAENNNKTNWSHWKKQHKLNSTPKHAAESQAPRAPEKFIPKHSAISKNLPVDNKLSIEQLKITNSDVHFINKKLNLSWDFSNVNLAITHFNPKQNFPVHLNFIFTEKQSPIKIKINLDALTNIDLATKNVNMPKFSINTLIDRPNAPTLPIKINGNFNFNNQQARMSLQNSTISIANMKIESDISATKLFTAPSLNAEFKTQNTEIKPLLYRLSNTTLFNGMLSFTTTIQTSGNNLDQLMNHISGKGALLITNGQVKQIDFCHLLDRAVAYAKQQPQPQSSKTNQTLFNKINGTYTINQSILTNKDLHLNGNCFTGSGQGTINLTSNALDFDLKIQHRKQDQTPTITLPIKISGSLNRPSISPNLEAVFKGVIKNQLQNILKKSNQDTKPGLGRFLKGITDH